MAKQIRQPKVLETYEIETSDGVITITLKEFVPFVWTAEEFDEMVAKKNSQRID